MLPQRDHISVNTRFRQSRIYLVLKETDQYCYSTLFHRAYVFNSLLVYTAVHVYMSFLSLRALIRDNGT